MPKISAYELLEMIDSGCAPVEVTFNGRIYELTEYGEYECEGKNLQPNLPSTSRAFLYEPVISYKKTLLTTKERAFIKALTDHMDVVHHVQKINVLPIGNENVGEFERINISYEDPVYGAFRWYGACFKKGTWFRGMERDEVYGLREVLWEGAEDDGA